MKDMLIYTAKNALKLGVAGGIIFGIGFMFVTQDPSTTEVGPAPAKADIADFMGTATTRSQEFTKAMAGLGLRPRVYDYNGNVMYFAVGSTTKRPKEVMYEIQDHLVDQGINKSNHSDMKPSTELVQEINWGSLTSLPGREAFEKTIGTPQFKTISENGGALLDGEVIPTAVSENRIEMVGYEKNREGKDVGELLAGDDSKRKVANLMGGYRYIDATWMGDETEVSAVWSAEDFSADRMEGKGNDQSPPDPDVPVCMGCSRDFRMQTIDNGDAFSSNMYNTSLGVDQTFEYYRAQMESRGWYEPGANGMLSRLANYMPELQAINQRGRILHLERGDDEAMQITIMPDEAGTTVMTSHEARDAQLAHPEKGTK